MRPNGAKMKNQADFYTTSGVVSASALFYAANRYVV